MLELTDTFVAALAHAAETARERGALSAAEQESLLSLPGSDGGRFAVFLEELRDAGVEIEPLEGDGEETPLASAPRRRLDGGGEPDLLDRYLHEIGRHPLLTPEEELRCARAARRGDEGGRRRLILGNLRLVIFLARRYRNRGLPLLDLVSEGNLGLVTAADRFDPERGVRFSTYAAWWIRQAVLRGIAEQTAAVRLPTTVLQQMKRYLAQERNLRGEFQRDPTPVEVGSALGLAPHQSERLAGLIQSARSLEDLEPTGAFARDDGLEVPGAGLSVEQQVETRLEHERLETFLRRLSSREETILRMRYGFHDGVAHTLQQTGDRFGITRERVRQIEKAALLKLRRWLAAP